MVVLACGKRGDPRPPVPVIPQATSDLVVTQRAGRIVLSWSYPALTTSGRSLSGLRRVVLYRYSEPLPATVPSSGPATAAEPGVPNAIAQFANVPTLAPAQFAKLSTRIDSIEGANLPAASTGDRLVYEDSPPVRSDAGQPVRYTYGVVTESISARSEVSNLVSIVPLDVAVAPTALTASASAAGVTLRWKAPATAATGSGAPVIVGYNIYRDAGELRAEVPQPINTTAVTDTSFTDTPPYGEHEYRVTAVASAGPPRIESDASGVAKANFRDLVAPPPPATLSALVETKQIRLIWDPVDAADLHGYLVYRIEAVGTDPAALREIGRLKFTPLPIPQTNFVDIGPEPGIFFRFEVTAVDKSGNESAPTNSGWVLVPKTP